MIKTTDKGRASKIHPRQRRLTEYLIESVILTKVEFQHCLFAPTTYSFFVHSAIHHDLRHGPYLIIALIFYKKLDTFITEAPRASSAPIIEHYHQGYRGVKLVLYPLGIAELPSS